MQGICGLLKRSADTRPVQIMAWRWLNKMEYNIPDTYGEGDGLGRKKKKWFKNVFRGIYIYGWGCGPRAVRSLVQ